MKEIPYVAVAGLGGQFQGSVFGMILDAGLMVQFVLLLLLLFSVISWAIIWLKHRSIKKVKKENEFFLDVYVKSTKLSDIFSEAKKFPESAMAEIFRAGYSELVKITKAARERVSVRETGEYADPGFEMKGIDNIERALNRATSSETGKLERALGFLATTGSACPFIGLFGTVWGIMDTFKGIGARGSATLAVVAPGISEALVATAAGLAAAIPAVIFYNYYTNKIKNMAMDMDAFASELTNIIERNYLK